MPQNDEKLELPGQLENDSDYTYYLSRDAGPTWSDAFKSYESLLDARKYATHRFSAACSGRVYSPGHDRDSVYVEGRMLICRCFAGREIATTVRELERRVPEEHQLKTCKSTWSIKNCRYVKRAKPDSIPFPVPIGAISEEIGRLAVHADSNGLILVTGSTNSAKSELARALIVRVLKEQVKQHRNKSRKRRPHLLTFEDPIERWLFQRENGEASSQLALASGVEYTPREKGVDTQSLTDALEDALRQTPSVFYIGEIREERDWPELLRFAGTGHLVIATAHAGSLIEAMARIFRGIGAETPAARGQIAQRIQAVIHQRKFDLQRVVPGTDLPSPFDVLLPALWRQTPAGVAALVSDGLSSVLPNAPNALDEETTSSFGRRWFARKLSKEHWLQIMHRKCLERDVERELRDIEDHLSTKLAMGPGKEPLDRFRCCFIESLAKGFTDFDVAAIAKWANAGSCEKLIRKMKFYPPLSADQTTELVQLTTRVSRSVLNRRKKKDLLRKAGELATRASTHFEIEAMRYDLMGT